ncbi:PKD domain-containing protein [Salibacter halophilus]|uniref:PKD domain-containing protein n=1 Tax=Salibacter halophilus TaxID=1803916 RepID=A0A6N6M414_9FLAO|nr:PKD domain-containing protein [Salibacter halophilus]KAB1061959.1 PKD domain-containing protein [Salibacter halophilus]
MKKLAVSVFALAVSFAGMSQTSNNLVDFEDINGHAPVETNSIDNNYFYNNYCIEFFHDSINSSTLPIYSQVGAPRTAFVVAYNTYSTSKGTVCNNISTDDDAPISSPLDEGCYLLTDVDAGPTQNPKPLVIDYDEDCTVCDSASGFLLDVDGNSNFQEGWRLEAFTTNPNIAEDTIYILSDDWSNCGVCPNVPGFSSPGYYNSADDGTAKYWEFQLNNPIDYLKFTYIGHPDRGAGIAFDEFYFCSIEQDTTPEPEICEVNAGFEPQIDMCKVSFTNFSAPGNSSTEIVGYKWTFGDGTSSNEENPVYFYDQPGVYQVCLEVTAIKDGECCTDIYCTEIEINEECPEGCEGDIELNYERTTVCDSCAYTFSANIFGNYYPVIGYQWDFGDGTTSTEANPTHVYQVPGAQQVCLRVVLDSPEECCIIERCIEIPGCEEVKAMMKNESTGFNPSDSERDFTDDVRTGDKVSLFPNPVNDMMNIELLDKVESSTLYNKRYTIFDVRGVEVQSGTLESTSKNKAIVDVSELPEGMYIMKINGFDVNESFSFQKK